MSNHFFRKGFLLSWFESENKALEYTFIISNDFFFSDSSGLVLGDHFSLFDGVAQM